MSTLVFQECHIAEAKGVEAVDRALKLLDCFEISDHSLTLAELSRRSGYYKSTILRIAESLDRGGYMLRQEDGQFRLGPALWRLGSMYRQNFILEEWVRPALKSIVEKTNETASYYVREGNSRVCLYRHSPQRAIFHVLKEGTRLTLEKGASAKVLMAWSDDAPNDLKPLREVGYAISMGERDPDVAAISIPLLDQNQKICGALAVSGLISRFDDMACQRAIEVLKESAQSLALNYVPA